MLNSESGLHYTAPSFNYRYSYNGKEKDDGIKGEGNSYDYGARFFDPRLGRFLSLDPLRKDFPWWTPFQYAGNSPIYGIDLDGLELVPASFVLNSNGIKIENVTEQDLKDMKDVISDFNVKNPGLQEYIASFYGNIPLTVGTLPNPDEDHYNVGKFRSNYPPNKITTTVYNDKFTEYLKMNNSEDTPESRRCFSDQMIDNFGFEIVEKMLTENIEIPVILTQETMLVTTDYIIIDKNNPYFQNMKPSERTGAIAKVTKHEVGHMIFDLSFYLSPSMYDPKTGFNEDLFKKLSEKAAKKFENKNTNSRTNSKVEEWKESVNPEGK